MRITAVKVTRNNNLIIVMGDKVQTTDWTDFEEVFFSRYTVSIDVPIFMRITRLPGNKMYFFINKLPRKF